MTQKNKVLSRRNELHLVKLKNLLRKLKTESERLKAENKYFRYRQNFDLNLLKQYQNPILFEEIRGKNTNYYLVPPPAIICIRSDEKDKHIYTLKEAYESINVKNTPNFNKSNFFTIEKSFNEILNMIPDGIKPQFIRINKSTIINISYLTEIKNDKTIKLKHIRDKEEINLKLRRQYWKEFIKLSKRQKNKEPFFIKRQLALIFNAYKNDKRNTPNNKGNPIANKM